MSLTEYFVEGVIAGIVVMLFVITLKIIRKYVQGKQ